MSALVPLYDALADLPLEIDAYALDGHERDLIALKFAGGLSNAEIAKVLELSETAVGTRLHPR